MTLLKNSFEYQKAIKKSVGCLLSFSLRLFAIGSQLSPEVGSSGIEMLETDVFKLHCFQTLTGMILVKQVNICYIWL